MVSGQWQMLALVGAVLGLAALALYFHPFYIVAIVIDVVIVARSGVEWSPRDDRSDENVFRLRLALEHVSDSASLPVRALPARK